MDEPARGRRWVVETDIADCFSEIPHDELLQAIEERVCDRSVLKLLRAILRAGVMEDGQVRKPVPKLPLQRLRVLLAELGLRPKEAKIRTVCLETGGEGVDFLGFHHRMVRSRPRTGRKPFTFLARWPADKAMQHARDRMRELTSGRRLLLPVEAIVGDVNAFLRDWVGYFKYGHSAERFSKIRSYVRMRLALFVSKKYRRSRHFGTWVLVNSTPRDFGLIGMYGIVVSPGRASPGGKGRMSAVNGVGKPCAGEPHARIDGRELETEHESGHGRREEPLHRETVQRQRLDDLPTLSATAPAPDSPT